MLLLNDRTENKSERRASSRERVDCNNILHQRRSDQSEIQRDDVVKVVYVPGLDEYVCDGRICTCWKENCPVRQCANYLLTQFETGSIQRSISAMTRCHWRSKDDVAERIEPHDNVTEKHCVSWGNFISAKQRAVEWFQIRAARETSSQGWRADTEISTSVKTVIEYSRSWKAVIKCSRSLTKTERPCYWRQRNELYSSLGTFNVVVAAIASSWWDDLVLRTSSSLFIVCLILVLSTHTHSMISSHADINNIIYYIHNK
jgi:hypothetical protein